MKSLHDSMQEIVDDAEFDAATERRLEMPLWGVAVIFGVAVITTSLLQGPNWLAVLLSAILGFSAGKIATCRRRRRHALARALRFKKHLGMPIAEVSS